MIGGNGDRHLEIAKGEGEFAAAEELFVLPALVVGVERHARIELCDRVQPIVVLREVLVTRPAAVFHPIVDRVPPIDLETDRLSGHERLRQIDAHHGLVDRVRQRLSAEVGDLSDPEAAIEHIEHAHQAADAHAVAQRAGVDLARVAVLRAHVLIELQPQVIQLVRALVVVGDRLAAGDLLFVVVQLDLDVVVRALLPVLVPGRAARSAVGIGRGKFLIELAELVAAVTRGILRHGGTHDQRGEEGNAVLGGHSAKVAFWRDRNEGSKSRSIVASVVVPAFPINIHRFHAEKPYLCPPFPAAAS